jgi:hypothetical protein
MKHYFKFYLGIKNNTVYIGSYKMTLDEAYLYARKHQLMFKQIN